jgi:hypothetical protein
MYPLYSLTVVDKIWECPCSRQMQLCNVRAVPMEHSFVLCHLNHPALASRNVEVKLQVHQHR